MPEEDATRTVRGRGASSNPKNRFERIDYAFDEDAVDEIDRVAPRTELYRDTTRSAIARNDSPDIGFDASINPYRGCEHGCIYCYARPTHEYLGFSAGLDFEAKIMVKEDLPDLLRRELASKRWTPQVIAISGVTDPYQPVERGLRLTRQCLEVLAAFRNPVAVITKNHLVTRDIDLLGELAARNAAAVCVSVTTLDAKLAGFMEPRASRPRVRLDAIRQLSEAGIPVGVMVAPVIPAITDSEIPAILQASAEAGATFASYIMLRLPHAVAPLFDRWLDEHYPERRTRVLHRLRDLGDGKLYDSRFGIRQRGSGAFAEEIERLFEVSCRRCGLAQGRTELSVGAFARPNEQRGLF